MSDPPDDGGSVHPQDRLRPGLSLRDYFAAHALAVIPGDVADCDELARDAYRIADALIAERRRTVESE